MDHSRRRHTTADKISLTIGIVGVLLVGFTPACATTIFPADLTGSQETPPNASPVARFEVSSYLCLSRLHSFFSLSD